MMIGTLQCEVGGGKGPLDTGTLSLLLHSHWSILLFCYVIGWLWSRDTRVQCHSELDPGVGHNAPEWE